MRERAGQLDGGLPIADCGLEKTAAARLACHSAIRNPHSTIPRRGFTLTEILVVMLIVILVLAAAVPAFRALTGSRSLDAAENLVTAMLGRARTAALNEKKVIGVFFHLDPVTDRTIMRLVQLDDDLLDDPDPLDQYKGWVPGAAYQQGNLSPLVQADRVLFITVDNELRDAANNPGKPMVKLYRCIQDHTANTTNAPPTSGTAPFQNAWWEEYREGNLSLVPQSDPQALPNGIGLQLINDPRTTNLAMATDRYTRTGVILFDQQGRLAYRRFSIAWDNSLGQLLHLTRDLGFGGASGTLYSGFGVALWPLDEFRGQPGASEGDSSFSIPGLAGPGTASDERAEEAWLDKNTTPLLINRYTGTIGATE